MQPPNWQTISPPPLSLFVLEQGRAALELARVGPRRKLLDTAPRGDGHPVLVLPGLLAGDLSTIPLRGFLRALSYDARGWGLGVNVGPTDTLRTKLDDLLLRTREKHDQTVSLVGWSLGGIYARELARAHPDSVRCLITLGTPFRDISATHVARLVPIRPGGRSLRKAHELRAYLRTPVPVPTTSIFSKTDGIVHWQSCLEMEGPERENVEVACSHTGMGFHAETLAVVADRLAQPIGKWRYYAKRA
ncbi:MAG TPA: alpha/beta hydrolase [Myxococcota bacterium]|nr:alpha/beta hydrolase [Myxococcota bacterium]